MIEKICPVCNKKFVVSNRGGYLYKKNRRKLNSSKMIYYCGYDCYRKDNPDKPSKGVKGYGSR